MDTLQTAQSGCLRLSQHGAEKASCSVSASIQHELVADVGRLSLLRSTHEVTVGMVAIQAARRGAASGTSAQPQDLEDLACETLRVAKASSPDEAYDVADAWPPAQFVWGPQEPDLSLMVERFNEFLHQVRESFPPIILDQAIMRHTYTDLAFVNSKGVCARVHKGLYSFSAIFSARVGDKTSSFNHTSFVSTDLSRPLLAYGSLERLLAENVEQTEARPLRDSFVGDVILTPDVAIDLLATYFATFLTDRPLTAGTSRLKDSLGRQVMAPCITVLDHPQSPLLADHHFLTPDGFPACNHSIVERGVLKTFLLSLYGARKTGHARAANLATSCIVEPGEESVEGLVAQVSRGLVLGRFSGGNPGESGELSGVAKNSFYVEDGRRRFPLAETMISVNLVDLFARAEAVSAQRVDFGSCLVPWIRCSGVTISGR